MLEYNKIKADRSTLEKWSQKDQRPPKLKRPRWLYFKPVWSDKLQVIPDLLPKGAQVLDHPVL